MAPSVTKPTAASVLTSNVLLCVSVVLVCVRWCLCVCCCLACRFLAACWRTRRAYFVRAYHLTSAKDSDLLRGACPDLCAQRASTEAYGKTIFRVVGCRRARVHCTS
ncbi:hypothetical protein PF005_g16836 [Phytophthora fragariae]|uniref:Uncharacterized protein n=1 Tax=Phytophthora fragariae TaxID=53985 RepID=A0A6A3JJU8_9STRA|nr:hypothetical protein PF003_g32881 [Phytophthora fragariae]KAE8931573.1 hypothetical protein PF009_g18367 [Phytophthora fragariae]KAE8995379.1 hypothetical protein PF011_g16358 [Phytophthora fragariae]KAE9095645.1 hypothetical protein PF007_g17302 [Phytophthora fragariae]KAE9095945.1 hypothetical protein PF010_g16517 [Phytophthora fragariae]